MPIEDQSGNSYLLYKLGDLELLLVELLTRALARRGPDFMDPCLV